MYGRSYSLHSCLIMVHTYLLNDFFFERLGVRMWALFISWVGGTYFPFWESMGLGFLFNASVKSITRDELSDPKHLHFYLTSLVWQRQITKAKSPHDMH